jgi:hypothetical protein
MQAAAAIPAEPHFRKNHREIDSACPRSVRIPRSFRRGSRMAERVPRDTRRDALRNKL